MKSDEGMTLMTDDDACDVGRAPPADNPARRSKACLTAFFRLW